MPREALLLPKTNTGEAIGHALNQGQAAHSVRGWPDAKLFPKARDPAKSWDVTITGEDRVIETSHWELFVRCVISCRSSSS